MLKLIQTRTELRQSKMAANSKFHAVSQTAYARALGYSCHVGDSIWHEGVNLNRSPKCTPSDKISAYVKNQLLQ